MKRWLLILLVVLAVVLLLSPGIIGRLAERNIDEGLTEADLDNENIRIEAESFRRGWFTSAGRHRVVLQGGLLADLVGAAADEIPGTPALVIETRIDHGLVPLTSLERERGSLGPGLANAVSSFELDRGDGELVELPGRVYGFIGLRGNASFRFLLEAGRSVAGNATTEWQGADLTYSRSADGLRRSLEGTVAPATIAAYGVSTSFGKLSITADRDRRRHRLGEGSIDLVLESLAVQSPGDPDLDVGPLSLTGSNRIEDGRSSGQGRLRLAAAALPGYGPLDVDVDLEFDALDAEALATVVDAWQTLYGIGEPATDAELMAAYPALERELETLAARGGRIEIENARVALPQGDWRMTLVVDVAETAAGRADFGWPAVLLNTQGELGIRLAAGLYEHLVAVDPQLRAALATGLLIRKGDHYEMKAALARGRLTINGAPIDLPAVLSQ